MVPPPIRFKDGTPTGTPPPPSSNPMFTDPPLPGALMITYRNAFHVVDRSIFPEAVKQRSETQKTRSFWNERGTCQKERVNDCVLYSLTHDLSTGLKPPHRFSMCFILTFNHYTCRSMAIDFCPYFEFEMSAGSTLNSHGEKKNYIENPGCWERKTMFIDIHKP